MYSFPLVFNRGNPKKWIESINWSGWDMSPRDRFGSQSYICIRTYQLCHGLLRPRFSRNERSREKWNVLWKCKLPTPLSFFQGLLVSFSCPSAALYFVFFCDFFRCFRYFGVFLKRLELVFILIAFDKKKRMESQCSLKWDFLAGRKQITSSQSTCRNLLEKRLEKSNAIYLNCRFERVLKWFSSRNDHRSHLLRSLNSS